MPYALNGWLLILLTQKYEMCILEKETNCRKVTNFRCQEYLEQLIGQTTWMGVTQKVKWTALKYWMLISLIARGYVTICNAIICTHVRNIKCLIHAMYISHNCQCVQKFIQLLSTAYRNANWKWLQGKPCTLCTRTIRLV